MRSMRLVKRRVSKTRRSFCRTYYSFERLNEDFEQIVNENLYGAKSEKLKNFRVPQVSPKGAGAA